MKKVITFLLFLVGILANNFAQPFCQSQNDAQQFIQNIANMGKYAAQRGATKYIPVRFHVVADDFGNSPISYLHLNDAICKLNEAFAAQNMFFYMSYENSNLYDVIAASYLQKEQGSALAKQILDTYQSKTAMNVWIVESLSFPNGTITLFQGVYFPKEDRTIIAASEIIKNKSIVLIHETGHFFSLPHLYTSWDIDFWETVKPNAVLTFTQSNGTIVYPAECKNGTNCMISGDGICDTPPDYGFGYEIYGDKCEDPPFKVIDLCGDTLILFNNNFLGSFFYGHNCTQYIYTPMQFQLMETDFFSAKRDYLRTNPAPSFVTLNSTVTYKTPLVNATTTFYNNIAFDWDDVPNATQYFLEISTVSTFQNPILSYVCDKSEKIVTNLSPSKVYYWRVVPANSAALPCVNWGTITARKFFTSSLATATKDNSLALHCSFAPNPTHGILNISISSTNDEAFELNVIDLQGKNIYTQHLPLSSDLHREVQIDLHSAAAGLYFVQIKGAKSILTERVVKM